MIGAIVVWTTFVLAALSALRRPWFGCVAYYFFVLLQPKWNWSWSIPHSVSFQKYLVIATIIGLGLSGFRSAKLGVVSRRVCICLTAVVFIAWVGAFQSVDPESTWYLFDSFWKMGLMLVLTAKLVDNSEKLRVLMWGIAISHSYNAFRITEDYLSLGYCQFIEAGWGYTGSNQTAIIAVACAAVAIALAIYEERFSLKLAAAGILVFQVHEVMLLESRSSMLGLACVALVAFWMMPKKLETVVPIVCVAIAGMILAGPSVTKEFGSIFAAEEQLDNSAASRFKTWSAGIKVAQSRPVLGAGFGASSKLVPLYYEGGLNRTSKNVHNLPIEVAADIGIPAAILYYIYFGYALFIIIGLRIRNREFQIGPNGPSAMACVAGVAGASFASLFSSAMLLEVYYLLAIVGANSISIFQQTSDEDFDSAIE